MSYYSLNARTPAQAGQGPTMRVDRVGAATAWRGIEAAVARPAAGAVAGPQAAVQPVEPVTPILGSVADRVQASVAATRAETAKGEAAKAAADKVAAEKDGNAVKQAVGDANRELMKRGTELNFQVDDKSGTLVVKLVDTSTKEVLRQYPSKEALVAAQALQDHPNAGALLRTDA
jgi:flagellar protein FlaG